jgi:hypothetical protein
MKGENIPDTNHVSRYCKPTDVQDGLQATAFQPRPNEDGLSVHWVELLFSHQGNKDNINKLRDHYSTILKIGASAKIALLSVGKVKEIVKKFMDRELSVIHDPLYEPKEDEFHSLINNVRPNYEFVSELILETINEENDLFPARHLVVK